jgi:phosphoglycerate dehydrogenase-like enzyme
MSITNVLFIWKPTQELQEYLLQGCSTLRHVKLVFPADTEEDTLQRLAADADIIIGWRPTKALLAAATNLGLFINPGVGVQHLIELFRDITRTRPITLVNGHGNTYFTAQHTVALLLACMNKIVPHHNWMLEGAWRKGDADAISTPLRDRIIGLVGYGAVNQKVHHFLKPYAIEFAICKRDWGRYRVTIPDSMKRYTPQNLDAFFDHVDIVIIAVPLTSMTEGMITAAHLSSLGKEGIVVNVARGPVVVEEALYLALKEHTIAGAALDVWYEYRPEPDEQGRQYPFHYPFNTLDNVVLSPHRAASPFNDLKRWDEVIENITRYVQGRSDFLNIVDLTAEY